MASTSIIGRQKEIEENILNKIEAFLDSKQHKPSHSLQVILVTSFSLKDRREASCINEEVTLDDLFTILYV